MNGKAVEVAQQSPLQLPDISDSPPLLPLILQIHISTRAPQILLFPETIIAIPFSNYAFNLKSCDGCYAHILHIIISSAPFVLRVH